MFFPFSSGKINLQNLYLYGQEMPVIEGVMFVSQLTCACRYN